MADKGMAADPKRRVRVQLFKDSGRYKEPLYVAVNGKNFVIPRGVPVDVPYYVAKVIEQSQRADERTAAMISRLEQDFQERATQYIG